jgi:hypothetical protein
MMRMTSGLVEALAAGALDALAEWGLVTLGVVMGQSVLAITQNAAGGANVPFLQAEIPVCF